MSILDKLEKAENFEKYLDENKSSMVVLYFAAHWSDECKLMSEVIKELGKDEKNHGGLARFLEIEAEDNEELSIKYGVEAVPSFVFLKNGREVLHKLSGADASELRKKLAQLRQSFGAVAAAGEKSEQLLKDRLKRLLNQAPVVLFMKGSPQEPRCGNRVTLSHLTMAKIDC